MVTIREIAKKAGVSRIVVSAILRGNKQYVRYSAETAQRVLRIAQELGYRPHRAARGLVAGKNLTIGVCFAWQMAEVYRHPAMAFVMAGISERLGQDDYGVLLRANPSASGYLPTPDLFSPNEVDGVLLIGAIRCDDPNLASWCKSHLPTVLVSTPPKLATSLNCTDIDNFRMPMIAVDYLARQGHRRIGLVLPGLDYTCHRANLKGFQQALEQHNLPFRKNWVWIIGYTAGDGYRFAQEFFALSNRPEALVFLAEIAAIGFGRALIEQGCRLPDDLSLVIKEKIPNQMGMLSGIVVLEAPYFQLGQVAADVLLSLLRHELTPPVQRFLSPSLRVISP